MGKFATVQITLIYFLCATNEISDIKTKEVKVLPIKFEF